MHRTIWAANPHAALHKDRRCASYISFDREALSASDRRRVAPHTRSGGSEDGRASLYGDGLVRLWVDGPAADGEYAGSEFLIDTFLRRLQRVFRGKPHQTRPPAEEGLQKVDQRKKIGEKIIQQARHQKGGEAGSQEERQKIGQEVR